jgi:hypothetical protein
MAFDDLNLVTVVGQAVTLDGKPAKGTVTFASSALLIDQVSGQAIFGVPLSVSFDPSGAFTINLPATNDPDIRPIGWVYQVTVNVQGAKQDTFQFTLPYDASGPVDLFLAAPTSDSGVVYVPAAAAAADPLLPLMFGRTAWLLLPQ